MKSILFFDGKIWKKKNNDSLFDVTMGSFGGAEGLPHIQKETPKIERTTKKQFLHPTTIRALFL